MTPEENSAMQRGAFGAAGVNPEDEREDETPYSAKIVPLSQSRSIAPNVPDIEGASELPPPVDSQVDLPTWRDTPYARSVRPLGSADSAVGSLSVTKSIDPDRAARAAQLADKHGLDFETALRTLPQIEEYEAEDEVRTVLERSPKTAAWLENPINAATARDSVNKLAELESQADGYFSFSGIAAGFYNAPGSMAAGVRTFPAAPMGVVAQTLESETETNEVYGQAFLDRILPPIGDVSPSGQAFLDRILPPIGDVSPSRRAFLASLRDARTLPDFTSDPTSPGFIGDPMQPPANYKEYMARLKLIPRDDRTTFEKKYLRGRPLYGAVGLGESFDRWSFGMKPKAIKAAEDLRASASGHMAAGEAMMPETDSALQSDIQSGFFSLSKMVPAVATAAVTRNPTLGSAAMGGGVVGESYVTGRDEGLSIGDASEYAFLMGGIEFATEKIPFDILFKRFSGPGKESFFKRTLKYQVYEQATEQVATHAGDFVDWQYLNPDGTWEEYLAERPERARSTAVSTLVASGSMQTVTETFAAIMDRAKPDIAEEDAKTLERMRAVIEDTPAFNRRRESVEEFVRDATGDAEVFLDGNGFSELYQTDADFANVVDELGLTQKEIERAIAGEDLTISAARLLTIEKNETQNFAKLLDIVRTSPGSLTVSEARSAREMADTLDFERIAEDLERDVIGQADFEAVQQAVQKQLIEAGRSPQESKAAGAVWGALVRVLDDRSSDQGGLIYDGEEVGAIDVLRMMNLKIKNQKLQTPEGGSGGGTRFTRSVNPEVENWQGEVPERPTTFTQWIKSIGGINDEGGEISAALGGTNTLPGVISNLKREGRASVSGRQIDDVAQMAVEAGFFPAIGDAYGADLPSHDDIIEALRLDVAGNHVFPVYESSEAGNQAAMWDAYTSWAGQAGVLTPYEAARESREARRRDAPLLEGMDDGARQTRDMPDDPDADVLFQAQNEGILFQGGASQQAPVFYSALERFVSDHKQGKASADQWKGIISKAPGIKAEEIEWTGVNDWLDAQEGSITREDLAEYLDGNGVQVEEIVKGGAATDEALQGMLLPLIEERDDLQDTLRDDYYDEGIHEDPDHPQYQEMLNIQDRVDEITQEIDNIDEDAGSESGETKWSEYTLPGGENYTELLLTLPMSEPPLDTSGWSAKYAGGAMWDIVDAAGVVRSRDIRAGFETADPSADQQRVMAAWKESISYSAATNTALASKKDVFRSSHWSEPNVLAHARFKEREGPNGERVLALEEIQSDWHQDGRKRGYKSEVDVAAFEEKNAASRRKIDQSLDALITILNTDAMKPVLDGPALTRSERDVLGQPPKSIFIIQNSERESLLQAVQNTMRNPALSEDTRRDLQKHHGEIRGAQLDIIEAENKISRATHGVPNASFKNNAWVNLVLKRMIRYAAENDFDSVAWIPGNIQNGSEVNTDDDRADFYNKIVPNAANKLGKKYGAKVEVIGLGQRKFKVTLDNGKVLSDDQATLASAEAVARNFEGSTIEEIRQPFWSLPITDELRTTALEVGFPLFQPKKKGQEPRGSVRIPGVLTDMPGAQIFGPEQTVVDLTKADKSTFMHETAHIFLEVYAALEAENPGIADVMNDIRKYLKLEPGTRLTRDQHEKFAESFEIYLMEGKAPTPELRSAFQQFKAWLTALYKNMRDQLLGLSPEAREIFDRMLATDEEIQRASAVHTSRMRSVVQDIMTPDQLAKHAAYIKRAGEVARDALFRKHVDQIKRRQRKTMKDDRDRLTGQITKEIEKEGVYRALADHGDGKALNPDVDVEMVAPDYGFQTGEDLVNAIAKAPNKENLIKRRVRDAMDDLHGNLLTDGSAEMEAVDAVYNEANLKALEVERDAAAFKAARETIPLNVIKARAKIRINEMPISEVMTPGRYAIKARDLHKKSIKMAAQGKWAEAMTLTQQAMYHHELTRLSFKAVDDIGKINRYLGKFLPNRKLDPKRIDPEYITAIRDMMSLPGEDNQQEVMARLRDFADKMQNEGWPVTLPNDVVSDSPLPLRKNMTLEQLRDFRDGIKNLNKIGRENSEAGRAAFRAEVAELAAEIENNYKGKEKYIGPNKTLFEATGSSVRNFEALILRYPFLIEAMQGGLKGKLVDVLETGLRRQLTDRNARRRDMGQRLINIMEKHGISQAELGKRYTVPELDLEYGRAVTFETIFSMALNMGNESNRQRVDSDPKTASLPEIEAVLAQRLEKRHWDAVQDVWDLIDELWPEASAVDRRMTGVTPKKVEASSVQTPHGTYRGGYYPLKYEGEYLENDDITMAQEADLWKQSVNGMATHAVTKKGHLKDRAQTVTRPLRLSLDTIMAHIDDVTNDIYLREEALKLSRIFRSPAFREAVSKTHGKEYIKTLETVLKRVVHGTDPADNSIQKMFRTLRINASVGILGANIRTAALAPISYFQTVGPRYGLKTVLDGIYSFYMAGPSARKKVLEMSSFMRERVDTLNREAHERVRQAKLSDKWSKVQGAGYWLMTEIEIWSVSGPVWVGVYKDALAKGDTKQDAITAADRAVATTQGSGLEIDQSILQGGSEFDRALTFMWGYVSGYYGIVRNDITKAQGFARLWPIAKHLIIFNLIASLIEAVLRMKDTGDDEEDPYVTAVADMMQRNVFGMIPGVSTVFNRYGSESPAMAAGQSIAQTGEAWIKAGGEYFEKGKIEGDTQYKLIRQTLKTFGIAAGVPGTLQADKTIRAFIEDDDPTLNEIIMTGPSK